MPTGRGSSPVDMPDNMDGVAKPAELSAIGNRPERPSLMRGNVEWSAKRRTRGSGDGLPALQINRRRMVGTRGARRVGARRQRCALWQTPGRALSKINITRGENSLCGSGAVKIKEITRGNTCERDARLSTAGVKPKGRPIRGSKVCAIGEIPVT